MVPLPDIVGCKHGVVGKPREIRAYQQGKTTIISLVLTRLELCSRLFPGQEGVGWGGCGCWGRARLRIIDK